MQQMAHLLVPSEAWGSVLIEAAQVLTHTYTNKQNNASSHTWSGLASLHAHFHGVEWVDGALGCGACHGSGKDVVGGLFGAAGRGWGAHRGWGVDRGCGSCCHLVRVVGALPDLHLRKGD